VVFILSIKRIKGAQTMNLIKLFICMIIFFFSTPAYAEFYKYVDENGNIHFTDDFNRVPEDQRAGLKGYEESTSDTETDTVDKKTVKKKKAQNGSEDLKKLQKFHDRLNITRSQLMEEYDQIEKEREQIIKNKKNAKTDAEAKQANERIKQLKKKQEELKKKFDAFEVERQEYRKQLEEAEAKQKEEIE
jgi:hypothetical protein